MADNIKIVGEILNTQEIPRYNVDDLNLLSPFLIKEDFGQQNDYIEYYVYDAGGNLLEINYNYKSFKLPTTSYMDPVNGSLPIIEIDPIKDLQNLGYSSGEFNVRYNFFNNTISNADQQGLFLKEVSADRTEIRVGSTTLTNEQIESGSLAILNSYSSSVYFVDYIINFGDNVQSIAVNTALNKLESGYEILFKLYEPLPDNISDKSTLWIVKEKINPYVFEINLDRLILPPPAPQLKGPNFAIDVPNQNNVATPYQTFSSLVTSINTISTASYQQFLSLVTSQSIDINTDYSDFNNFVFFSSAKKRITNFYDKVKQIEDYKTDIAKYTVSSSLYPNMLNDLNRATASINELIAGFDGFEYYLYFESGSTLTSSLDYNITPYPKTGSLLPYPLLSTSSVKVQQWYDWATGSAEDYDDINQNKLTFTVPSFIKDDGNNEPYLNFLDMVGHYFDNIWIFLSAITDINLANNNLEKGVSKDLVYYVLESLGTKLYNQYGDSSNLNFLIGNSGSANFDDNFTSTGSYLNTVPRKDLLAESYKRISKTNLIEDKMNREMLKEAIAEAKTIKETAIASAKAALEEAFAPQLTAMFAERLNEMDEEERVEENDYSDEEFSLEDILAELGKAEDDSEMKDEGMYENLDEDLVLEDMSDEDIEELVTSVIDDMIASGKLMAGEESEEEMDMDDMEDMGDMEDMDMDIDMEDGEEEIEDEDEIKIDEILAEILGEEKKEVEEGADIPADEYVTGTQGGGVALGLAAGVAALAWSSLDKKQREELTTNAKAALQRYGDDLAGAAEWVKNKSKGILGIKETADVKEMEDTINELRNELNEVNLLNAKLLYTNKIFKAKNLTESESETAP